MPYSLNPDVGYVASANNKVVPDNYPYLIGTDWAAPYRAQRIVDLIESHDELSVDDFAAMQGDVHPIPADLFVPLLDGLSLDDADQAAQEALDLVTTWDRRMDADQAAPLIFQQFYLELARATVGDELEAAGGQDLVDSYLGDFSNEHHVMLQRLAAQPDNAWWDDVNSPQMETQTDIVQRAFLAAVDALQTAHGENPGKWRWGDVHWANFDHPLGAVSPLNLIFNKRIAARGSAFTIDAASLSYPDLVMDHGASFREIVDLGTLANSRIVNTTGQSGQAFDRHYGDMIELWQGVGYHPMLFERGDVEASAVDVLTLQPQ
jgi:penicillin amidase